MQWLNENDDASFEYLKNAFQRDVEDGVSTTAWLLLGKQINENNCHLWIVSNQFGAFSVLEFCGGLVHPAHTMLWCDRQTWMSPSWGDQSLYATIFKNYRQGAHWLCGHCQGQVQGLCWAGKDGKRLICKQILSLINYLLGWFQFRLVC